MANDAVHAEIGRIHKKNETTKITVGSHSHRPANTTDSLYRRGGVPMSSDTIEKTIIEVPPSNRRGSSSSESERFDQSKKEWAAQLDDEATALICKHYNIPESNVMDFEGITDDEYDVDDVERPLQHLDYAGVDKLVHTGNHYTVVAFRFRPQSDQYTVDFSYCVDNGTAEHTSEYEKHLAAHQEGGLYPTIYAFGITDESKSTLEEMHLIEMRPFLDCIQAGILNPSGPFEREGGVEALYYSVDELRDRGCILESWYGGDGE